jgi:hypothetical protein
MNMSDDRKAKIALWTPRVALAIALIAFCFQVFVLYPWHIELSKELARVAALVKSQTA